MLKGDGYTKKILDLAKQVHTLNAAAGYYELEGFAVKMAENELPRCECNDFQADKECKHLDAVWFAVDMGLNA